MNRSCFALLLVLVLFACSSRDPIPTREDDAGVDARVTDATIGDLGTDGATDAFVLDGEAGDSGSDAAADMSIADLGVDLSRADLGPSPLEEGCIRSGGTVRTVSCCTSVPDFPDTCSIGACGCAPMYSRMALGCDCGPMRCFDTFGGTDSCIARAP